MSPPAKARLLRGVSVLALLGLCRCSLLLNVDDLDEPDAAAAGSAPSGGWSEAGDTSADTGATGDARAEGSAGDGADDGAADAGDGREAIADGAGSSADATDEDSRAPADAADTVDATARDGGNAGADASDAGAEASDAADGGAGLDAGGNVGPDGCALVTHSDGLGQTWQDCTSLGTRNRTEAQKACNAFTSTGNCVSQSACNLQYVGVSLAGPGGGMTTYLWVYGTNNGAMASPGDVLVYASGAVSCSNLPQPTASWQ